MSISDERLALIAKECTDADGVSVGGWRFKSDYVSFADMGAITAELMELRAAAKVRAIREGGEGGGKYQEAMTRNSCGVMYDGFLHLCDHPYLPADIRAGTCSCRREVLNATQDGK